MYALGTCVNYVTYAMYALGTRVNYVTSAMYALGTRVNYVTYATYANSNTPNPIHPRLLFRVPPQDNLLEFVMFLRPSWAPFSPFFRKILSRKSLQKRGPPS